jgi:hypothetical protein
VVILVAVGSGNNLLVVSRLKEEIHAGLNTGIIRGRTGRRGKGRNRHSATRRGGQAVRRHRRVYQRGP